MKIILITPALPHSRSGNRATAIRWRNILRYLGHQVHVDTIFKNGKYDAMVALHSWRSADSIQKFNDLYPDLPLIVALTGTDLYKFIKTHPKKTLNSIAIADELVALHDLAYQAIPKRYHQKLSVIYQSAKSLKRQVKKNKKHFDICIVGHLRDEKDPLRAAYAVRNLPSESKIRVRQFGKAHDEKWADMAKQEMGQNPRYHWYGEVPHWKIRKEYASAQLMVLSSRMEGGANVISEACVAGLPVIASNIAGSIGLLGRSYPGYYTVGKTNALREQLLKAEMDHAYLRILQKLCKKKSPLFDYKKETKSWKQLLTKLI